MSDMNVTPLVDTEVTAPASTELSVYTDRGFPGGPITVSCSPNMTIM